MAPSSVRALHPRLGEQHQRQQPCRFWLAGHQLNQSTRQANCVAPQRHLQPVGPRVVDEIQHRQHRAEPVRQVGIRRHSIRDVGCLDLVLGPHQTFRHCRLGHQKRTGHLIDTQTPKQSQGQGNLVFSTQCRMATGEDQSKLVVLHGPAFFQIVAAARRVDARSKLLIQLLAPCRPATDIDCTVPRGRDDPPGRVRWDAVTPPPITRDDECILDRVLGKRDVAEHPDKGRDRLAVHLTKHAIDMMRFPIGGDGAGHALMRRASRPCDRPHDRSLGTDEPLWGGWLRRRLCRPRPALRRDLRR